MAIDEKKLIEDVIDLQKAYQKLIDEKRLTKKAMCDLVIPFRDKYDLKDIEALKFARNENSLSDILDLMKSLETKTSDNDVPDTNVGKWIPASEPPKESGAYYVTIDDSFAKELKVYIAVYDGSKWQTWANVIAWMPLPEAYKGEV